MMATAWSIAVTVRALRAIWAIPVKRGRAWVPLARNLLGIRNWYLYVRCQKVHRRRRVICRSIPSTVPAIWKGSGWHGLSWGAAIHQRTRTVRPWIIQIYPVSKTIIIKSKQTDKLLTLLRDIRSIAETVKY